MVKTKKNKKGMAEAFATKKKTFGKLNPFDIRTVRQKQKIIGRKSKNDVGKPGVARAKAIKVRKETLLQEYKLKNKSNMFLDKRIGEKDAKLSAEDKMIARYTAEKLKGTGKQSIFNLGDDYDLTHGGLSLDQIEKFDNPNSDDDDDQDEDSKRLDAKFVDEAHFGGFMTKTDDEFKEGRGNSRKEWIENLIRESKKRKAEKRKLDEEAEEKTAELDDNWKQLLGSVRGSSMIRKRDDEAVKADYDPYDMLVRQLTYEKKEARGGERLKTEDELIKEEKEKLEKLEADRLRRMRGEKEEKKASVSVEDMGDEEVKKKNKMSKKEKRKLLKQLLKGEDGYQEGDEGDESGEEEGDGEEGSDDDGEEEGSEEESEDDDDDDDEGEEEDKYSDLEEPEADAMDENEKDRYDAEIKAMIEKATAELPYSFSVPESYEEFTGHVSGRTVDEIKLILERIVKCNHPSLAEGNKEKLAAFYPQLLQYIQDCASSFDEEGTGDYNLEKIGLQVIEVIVPVLFQLTGMFQAQAAKAVQEVIKEKFEQFDTPSRKLLPGLDTLIFAKIVMLLFPSSDYRHPVVTPVFTMLCSILSRARPYDRATFASGLVLATILTEATLMSKRFVPELVNFIGGIFHVSSAKPVIRPIPPCKGGAFLISSHRLTGEIDKVKLSDVTSVKNIDEKFKASCLNTACEISLKLLEIYRDLPSVSEIFHPITTLIHCLNFDHIHADIVEKLKKIQETIKNLPAKSGAVVKPAKQVKMLRMMEPQIEEDFRPFEKKRTGDKTLLEEQKLRHKLKQEKKGARKEIRKDVAFLANQKARERRQKDDERREKTRSLLSNLANQEGDYQKIQRKKKKF